MNFTKEQKLEILTNYLNDLSNKVRYKNEEMLKIQKQIFLMEFEGKSVYDQMQAIKDENNV